MSRNKLAKLLLDEQNQLAEPDNPGTGITKFGLENITKVVSYLQDEIRNWNPEIQNYNPLFELAKIAFLTENDGLKAKCHEVIAKYTYPQIRGLEIQSKQDNNVTLKIELADYAKTHTLNPGDIEELEAEDIEETPHDYADMVLKAEAARTEHNEAADK